MSEWYVQTSAQMAMDLVVVIISCLIVIIFCITTQSRMFFDVFHVNKNLGGGGIALMNLLHHLFVVSFVIDIHGIACMLTEQVMIIVYIAEKK